MKAFSVLCALLVASYQVQASPRVGNVLDDLVKQALEVVRKQMKAHDPTPIPPGPPLVFKDPAKQTDLQVVISDGTVAQASNFVVDKISNNLVSLHSEFGMSFPTIQVEGNFVISGTMEGRTMSGQGPFKVEITNLVVNGEFQMESESGGTLQVKSNSVSYTIQDCKLTETGVVVDGMTDQQIQDWISTQLLQTLQNQEPNISAGIAAQTMIDANKMIEGKTLNDIIAALQKFIAQGVH